MTALLPGTITNDQPSVLTITGTNFVPGVQVTVGGQALTNVLVQSATALTATLSAGLCPGTYPATITSPAGIQTAAGMLTITGVQQVHAGMAAPVPTFKINGKAQVVGVPLTKLVVTDTTCMAGDITLTFKGSAYAQVASGRMPLTMTTFQLGKSGASMPASGEFTTSGDLSTVTLSIQRTGTPGTMTLAPTVTLAIPAHATVGQYVISLDVTTPIP